MEPPLKQTTKSSVEKYIDNKIDTLNKKISLLEKNIKDLEIQLRRSIILLERQNKVKNIAISNLTSEISRIRK